MFGMGGTEIIVILIVALLFLGPDKLPEAARSISKGIRDIKKQSRALQRTIEDDEQIGGAIRDLRSALRGEDEPIRPRPMPPGPLPDDAATAHAAVVAAAVSEEGQAALDHNLHGTTALPEASDGAAATEATTTGTGEPRPLTLPANAGEPDDDSPRPSSDASDLAALVRPAPNTIPRGGAAASSSADPVTERAKSEPSHG